MPQDLGPKIARLIGDYRCLFALALAIPHDAERRIVALGLVVKLDSLVKLLPRYRKQIRPQVGKKPEFSQFDQKVITLENDHKTGMRAVRHAMAGHGLHLRPDDIGDYWICLGYTVCQILMDDLDEIDRLLVTLSPNDYPGALTAPAIPAALVGALSGPKALGPPTQPRIVSFYAGLWTENVTGFVPGGPLLHDITQRAVGLLTYARQLSLIRHVMGQVGGPAIYDRLLTELVVVHLVALEELVTSGPPQNLYGPTASSLRHEWQQISHPGIPTIDAFNAKLPAWFQPLKSNVRNKIAGHVDPDIPLPDMEVSAWPATPAQIEQLAKDYCIMMWKAGCSEIRTRPFFIPPSAIHGAIRLSRSGKPWDQC